MPTDRYLSIGHVCMDVKAEGYALGGTASYSSILANALGYKAEILTSFGEDFQFENNFLDCGLSRIHSPQTTIFDNQYDGELRTQYLLSRATDITTDKITTELSNDFRGIVHVCPIANEVEAEIINQFDNQILTLTTPQGWMRQWNEDGKVTYLEIEWERLSQYDFVIISEEDVENLNDKLLDILTVIKCLIVTRGHKGASIYLDKKEKQFSAKTTELIDPTGAGDTFATAFITKYYQTRNITTSMNYANELAAQCVSSEAMSYLDTLS